MGLKIFPISFRHANERLRIILNKFLWYDKIVRIGCGCFAFGFFPLVYGYLVPYYVLPELLEKSPMGVARNFQKDN